MRCITRIHLSDCGWHEAYYPGTTIELADPRTGKPAHTVFSLENTGGKTSFLSLVLSCFDTSERRFLKTLIHSNQKFGDYFGDVPAFILVEWDLSGAQASLLESERLITGQVIVPRGEGRQREFERHFFTFRSGQGLALDNIPAPGLRGFDERGRLNGHQDLQRWLHEMRSSHPGNFQDFVRQSDWKRKLAEEKIDTELLAAQVEFNRSEGGIEDFLNFRSESQFLRKFLAMTVPEAEADAVRRVLAEHVAKLADLPRLERRRDAMRRLKEKFAPFVDIASKVQAAQEHVSRWSRHAASLKAAITEHEDQVSRQAEERSKATGIHEVAAEEAKAEKKTALIALASAAVEVVRRRHEVAEALAATRKEEQKQALSRRALLQAAVLMREILNDNARRKECLEAIDAQHADLQPHRDALREIGAGLVATLGQRATELRDDQRSLLATAEELNAAARESDAERATAYESAQAERRAAAQIDVNLGHARCFRAALEQEEVLELGEDADAAARRHAEAATKTGKEASALRLQAESTERSAARQREHQGDLKAERSSLATEVTLLRGNISEGETKRRALAFDSTIRELSGESEVNPGVDAVRRLLTDARSTCIAKLRDDERRQERLHADRESLEATGLASVDKDVCAIAERLRKSSIADAQPYAVYLSKIFRSADEVRRFAELDPARFTGVAVPSRNALDAARRALESAPTLSRPVTVAIADDTAIETPADRFVLPVDEPAAYDRAAALDLRRRIETDLARIASLIESQQARIERLESTLRELDAWRERFGGGRLDTMQQEADRKEARIAEIDGKIDALSEGIEAAERDASDCRHRASECDKQAHACTERSRRADEHHAHWESKLDTWRKALLAHQQRGDSAVRVAQEKEAERDAHAREARERGDEASEAANRAAAMEREASDITYSGSAGQSEGDLDALRRDYEKKLTTLKALEHKQVDRLRGRLDEIENALAEKKNRFETSSGELDRAQVEAEATRDGLRKTAADSDTAVEATREKASVAGAEVEAARKEYRSEKAKRAEQIRPESLTDLSSLEPEALARIVPQAEGTIVEQEAIAAREADAARRAREEATRNEQTAKECRNWIATLDGVLDGETVPTERAKLPRHDEVAALVNECVTALRQADDALSKARLDVYDSYDEIRKFTSSDTFRELESERQVAAHLGANDPLAAAHIADTTASLIDDRLETIEHDLLSLDDDLQACIAELERLLRTAQHILRRMIRDGHIPDHVPRFGGQPVFRTSADLTRVTVEQRREVLRSYVTALAEANRIPESGQDIAAELVERMTTALGRSSLGIRLLKPKGEGDTEHMPIDRVTVSGGELLTAAMMIYLVLARLRAEAMHGGASEGGVLIMDNPLGKANKALLLKTQISLADAMGIQLFYTTGVQDTNALAEFENIVRLRRGSQSRGTRRIHVEVEAMRAHIHKLTAEETVRPAVAAE